MTTTAPPPAVTTRPVNPFLLPAATVSRFILLITITLSAAAYSFDLVAGGPTGWRSAYAVCDTAADQAAARTEVSPDRLARDYLDCVTGVGVDRALASFGAMLVIALLIAAVYLALPRLTIRRQHLITAHPVTHADLYRRVHDLAAAQGLRRLPRVVLDLFRREPGGRAFGCYPVYYLRLNVGTLQREREKGGVRDPLLLHELAHLRNRDVDLTGLTIATTVVFGALISLPVLIYTAVFNRGHLIDGIARTLVASVVVALLAAAVFRCREHYADVRAQLAGGSLPKRESVPAGWFRGLLPMHPREKRRTEVLADPGLLMRWVPGEALGAGIAASLGLSHLSPVLRQLFASAPRLAMLLSAVMYGVPVAAILLSGAYRATLWALAAGRRVPRGVGAGLAFTAGLVIGLLVSPSPMTLSWAQAMSAAPDIALVMIGCLAALSLLFCRWLSAVATAWLPAARGKSWLPSYLGALVPASLALGIFANAWTEVTGAALETRSLIAGGYLMGAELIDAAVLTALVAAALFPLTSWFRQRTPGRGRALYLDDADPVVLPQTRVRPLLPLIPAAVLLVAGLAADAIRTDGLLPTWLYQAGARATGTPYDVLMVQLVVMILILAAVQFLSGLVVSALAGGGQAGLGPAHGALAAVASGVAAVVALMGPPVVRTCVGGHDPCDLPSLWNWAGLVTLVVLAVGLPCAFLGTALTAGTRVLTRKIRQRPPATGAVGLRRVLAAVTVLAVIGWLALMTPLWLRQWGMLALPRPPGQSENSARQVPAPGPPGTRESRAACRDTFAAATTLVTGDNVYVGWAKAFAHLAETNRLFLIRLGNAGYPLARVGDQTYTPLGQAATQYCLRV